MTVCALCCAGKSIGSDDIDYRRSSLYSVMISHTDRKFNTEIENVFLQIPIPDSYNDHDLSVKIVNLTGKVEREKTRKGVEAKGHSAITSFLDENMVASRLVGRWLERDYVTGICSTDLIRTRGLYAANEIERSKAGASLLGDAILEDAGEDLIQNTFVLVNDITYIDKGERSKNVGMALSLLGGLASVVTGDDSYAVIGDAAGSMAESLKGFSVKVRTSLYQLIWDSETAAMTWNSWNDRDAFENNRPKYRLRYIGDQESGGGTTSFLGIREDEPEVMIRKACQRALDANIANLQKNFKVFQVKTPLDSTEPIQARIGMKEGVDAESRFEVLEPNRDDLGRVTYKKVGEVKPVPNLIWDNRFMAGEELSIGANLGCTTFKKISGGDFLPGYLIRQIK